jgi:hypothetical protein
MPGRLRLSIIKNIYLPGIFIPPFNDLVINLRELSVIAILAFDAGFVADSLYPLIIAGYRVTIATLFIFPAVRKNIGSAPKQTPEDGNLLFWRI